MLHQRQAVDKQSYGTVAILGEELPLVTTPLETQSAPSQNQPRCSFRKFFCEIGPCLVLALIVTLTLMVASLPLTPSDDDDLNMAELRALSVVPLLGRRFELERAQNIADAYRDTYLADGAIVYHAVSDAVDFDSNTKSLPPEGCEGTVIILRHCDKGDVREHCDYLGFERSVYLSTLFGDDNRERWPAPSYIYALNPAHRRNPNKHNYREIETVLPMANKFGLSVDARFTTNTGKDLAENIFSLLQKGALCGKIAVISWKHSDIPHLARKLGT